MRGLSASDCNLLMSRKVFEGKKTDNKLYLMKLTYHFSDEKKNLK